jgi:hypothetical protein
MSTETSNRISTQEMIVAETMPIENDQDQDQHSQNDRDQDYANQDWQHDQHLRNDRGRDYADEDQQRDQHSRNDRCRSTQEMIVVEDSRLCRPRLVMRETNKQSL